MSTNSTNSSRRQLLERALFGSGYLGMKALATGIPIAYLSRPLDAFAQAAACAEPDKASAKFLIMSTSSRGDPMNANVPGTYDFEDIAHAADPRMAKTPLKLGPATTVNAAQLWSTLPQWVLDRTCFFHHATLTNNHTNLGKVLRLMGNTNRQEMLPSLYAKHLAGCLGTVQTEPMPVGAEQVLTFEGRGLPSVPPTALRDVLARPKGPLATFQAVRDKHVDRVYALLKQSGTATQRSLLDRMVQSRLQARSLSEDLLDAFAGITSNDSDGQITATVALIRMKVAPAFVIRMDFGGDNHRDPELMLAEVPQHETSIQRIGALWEALKMHGLEDKVVFAASNVFGRTLKKLGRAGRDHWGSHHCSILMGGPVKPGVVGGLEPKSADYYATPIDSKTGRAAPGGGDIKFEETHSAFGKTLGRALGVPLATLETGIRGGKPVQAALVAG